MEQLSFLEKLGVLFDNIIAHPVFICILLSPVLLIFLNKKITKKAIVLVYIAILGTILYVGNTTIFALFDNLMDGIFITLYFPNFITLFLVELLSAIICLITFLKKGITKTSKVINVTSFAIIQTIFILILTIVQTNNIDIYKENALYASNDVLTLMQLLMGTFALQIITLLVIKAIDKVTRMLDGEEVSEVKEVKKHLPEGRITHATLAGAKVITKRPEVIIEMPKTEPLDMSLIEESRINPLDLNEEIIKEKNNPKKKEVLEQLVVPPKPKVEIKYVIPEVKLDKLPDPGPLNRSLFEKVHIKPIDVNEEIIKEKSLPKIKVSSELEKKAKDFEKERLVFTVPEVSSQAPLDKSLIKEEKSSPIDVNEVILDEKLKVDEKPQIIKKTPKPKLSSKRKKSLFNFERKEKEIKVAKNPLELKPIEEANSVFTVPDNSSPLRDVSVPMETLDVPQKVSSKTVSENVNAINRVKEVKEDKPDLMKPMENKQTKIPTNIDSSPKNVESVNNKAESKDNKEIITKGDKKETVINNEEKELITNLKIIDYDKMVKAIKNLEIVYTL